jgi:predicted nucleotidyltransferase component of viral defense system
MQQNFYDNVLRAEDMNVLKSLPQSVAADFYLAGGTGLALRLGHRFSHDLDFFSERPFRNDVIKRDLGPSGIFELFQDSQGTIEGMLLKTRLTFLYYPHRLLEPGSAWSHITVASVLDMAAMKLSAVSSRGSRKDFIDLFFIKNIIEWDAIVEAFKNKYQDSGYNLVHIIKSLGWFNDAEKEPMPMMIMKCNWDDVKNYFLERQKDMARFLLGRRLNRVK